MPQFLQHSLTASSVAIPPRLQNQHSDWLQSQLWGWTFPEPYAQAMFKNHSDCPTTLALAVYQSTHLTSPIPHLQHPHWAFLWQDYATNKHSTIMHPQNGKKSWNAGCFKSKTGCMLCLWQLPIAFSFLVDIQHDSPYIYHTLEALNIY